MSDPVSHRVRAGDLDVHDAGHGAADTPLFWQVLASFVT